MGPCADSHLYWDSWMNACMQLQSYTMQTGVVAESFMTA